MRQLARFEEETPARTLSDALYVEGIESRVDRARDGGYLLWVHDERRMDDAQTLLELFEQSPDDPRFDQAKKIAATQRKAKEKRDEKDRHRAVDMKKKLAARGGTQVTFAIMAVCVGLSIAMSFSDNAQVLGYLTFSPGEIQGDHGMFSTVPFAGIRDGQVWRLITPVLVYQLQGFGIISLFFSMLWFRDLGAVVERIQGGGFLLLFVTVSAALVNVVNHLLQGPGFYLGFYPILLALLGYVWVRMKYEPVSPFALRPMLGLILIGFWVLNLAFGGVAHFVFEGIGLAVGAVWGGLVAMWKQPRRRR